MLWQGGASVTLIHVTRQAAGACSPGSVPGPRPSLLAGLVRPRIKGVGRPRRLLALLGTGWERAASEAGTLPSGLGIPQLLEAVLKLLPLDTYVETPVSACHHAAPPCSGPWFLLCQSSEDPLTSNGGTKPCAPKGP